MNKFFKIILLSLLVAGSVGCVQTYAPQHAPQPVDVGPSTNINLGSENPDDDVIRITSNEAVFVPQQNRIEVEWDHIPGYNDRSQTRLPERKNCRITFYNAGSPFGNPSQPCRFKNKAGNDFHIYIFVDGDWRPVNLAIFKGGFVRGNFLERGIDWGPFSVRRGSRQRVAYPIVWSTTEPISGYVWSDLTR